jgi:transposase
MRGRISRHGDTLLRPHLHEAAAHIPTRSRIDGAIRRRGTAPRERIGFERASAAAARELAVILHAMWRSGMPVDAEGTAAP